MPVDAQVCAQEREVGGLEVAVFLVRVAGRHVQRLIDFETPGAALDRLGGGHFGEEAGGMLGGNEERNGYLPIHAELHFLLVVGDRGVDFMQLFADLRAYVPA